LNGKGIKDVYGIFPRLTLKDDSPRFEEKNDVALLVTPWDHSKARGGFFIEETKRLVKGKIVLAGNRTDSRYMEYFKKRSRISG